VGKIKNISDTLAIGFMILQFKSLVILKTCLTLLQSMAIFPVLLKKILVNDRWTPLTFCWLLPTHLFMSL